MAKHNPIIFGSIGLSKLSNKCENEPSFFFINMICILIDLLLVTFYHLTTDQPAGITFNLKLTIVTIVTFKKHHNLFKTRMQYIHI